MKNFGRPPSEPADLLPAQHRVDHPRDLPLPLLHDATPIDAAPSAT